MGINETHFHAVDAILAGFFEAMLFSSSATLADGSELSEDLRGHFDWDGLDPESRESMRAFCARFYAQCSHLVPLDPGSTWEDTGRLLWFTIAGHGCGFWDGSRPQSGRALSEWCDQFGHLDAALGLYVDDMGRLCLDGLPAAGMYGLWRVEMADGTAYTVNASGPVSAFESLNSARVVSAPWSAVSSIRLLEKLKG